MSDLRGPRSQSFANQVRTALQTRSPNGEEVAYSVLAIDLDLPTDHHKQKLYNAMRDFFKRGEAIRVKPGVVRYVKKDAGYSKKEKMWRAIRCIKPPITTEELAEMADVSEAYALEFLIVCTTHGILKRYDRGKKPHVWRMINDPVEMPEGVKDANASKLRRMRAKQREAESAFTAAELAIQKGREAVADLTAIAHE